MVSGRAVRSKLSGRCAVRAGTRQVVQASGKSIMLFYYRDALYAVESRSPAEGAYSEGFMNARFTQALPPTQPGTLPATAHRALLLH